MAERIDVDVCVVGAGYAGLTTARRVQQAGRSVVVLEARDRIGGRIWTEHLDDGTPIDRGGGWLAPYHDRALALAGEVGVGTFKTYVAGKHLLVDGDRVRRYRGLIPKIGVRAVATLALAQLRIDRMARQVPVESPWTAPKAAEWDATSVAEHLASSGIPAGVARELFDSAVRGLMTGPLEEVSLLHLLFLCRAHQSISKLFSIEGGAQENLVVGGAGEPARRVAAELGDAVRLGQPVRSIAQLTDHVEVQTATITVKARRVVVTIPPALVPEIAFVPELPPDRLALYRAATAGPETKTLLVYDQPFWRSEGFSGQTAGPASASEVTIDASPVDAGRGVLASFTFGRVAKDLAELDAAERRRATIDAIAARLGPRAAAPDDVVETQWWTEPWTLGCSFAHLPPGALTRWGPLLRAPFGLVHWAGTETATTSHGAIDGAVRSGERAAAEVLSACGVLEGAGEGP